MSYRTDLKSILKKAPSSFHTINNLEMVAQFVSDAIKIAYEINCPEKPKYTPSKISWSRELSERRTEVEKAFQQRKENQNHHGLGGF